jgi:NAD+ synthase
MYANYLIDWLRNYKQKENVKGVVLGLSGGKDSTVVAMLAKKVWGDNVLVVLMPNGVQKDISDSLEIAQTLGLNYKIINIGEAYNYIATATEANEKSRTNIAPRLRMTTLYALAQNLGYRVIGTGNLSESFIGWTTKFGDSACDFNPIGNCTCSEVIEIGKELAEVYGLPMRFIEKTPADGLTGKSDEDNFGFTYKEVDEYIRHRKTGPNIEKIIAMNNASHHKRHMPKCAE